MPWKNKYDPPPPPPEAFELQLPCKDYVSLSRDSKNSWTATLCVLARIEEVETVEEAQKLACQQIVEKLRRAILELDNWNAVALSVNS
jgi:hypothetical protein